MPDPISFPISAVAPPAAVTSHAPAAAAAAAAHGPPVPSPAAQAAGDAARPNPTVYLDPKLGIVVIELRDNAGKVTNSIPSERLLQAYRSGLQNPPPAALAAAAAAAPAGVVATPMAQTVRPVATRPSPPPTPKV